MERVTQRRRGRVSSVQKTPEEIIRVGGLKIHVCY